MITPSGLGLPRVLTPLLAARLGVSRSRVRTELARGSWRLMARGVVLTRPDEPTRLDWAEAGVVTSGPSAAISGWDALRLHGLRGTPSGLVLVLVRTGRSRRMGPVLVRRTDRPYSTTLTAFEHPLLPLVPIVGAARAVADAAIGTSELATVRALVARAVQQKFCALPELGTELDRCPRAGSAHLRTALAEVAAGARSAAEARAFVDLRRSRLPNFELNVPVVDSAGDVIYVLDVLWRELRAGMEIDSREYHFGQEEWQATMRRHNALTAGALSLVHYPPSRIMRDKSWVTEVERWLRARARELTVPYTPGRPNRVAACGTPPPITLAA